MKDVRGLLGFFKPNIKEMEKKRDVDGLIKALRNRDSQVRRSASAALVWITDKRAMEPLAQALKDEDDCVRGNAAEALCRIGDNRVVEPLIQALKDKDWLVRRNSAKALGIIGDPRANDPLAQALEDESESVRMQAAEALGRRNDLRAFETLAEALKDEDIDVRRRAIRTLGKMKGERALELLIQALKDSAWSVRTEAARILGRKSDPNVIEPLMKATEDEDSIVRVEAAEALGKLGHPRTIEIPIKENWKEMKSGVSLKKYYGEWDALEILSRKHDQNLIDPPEIHSESVTKLFQLTGNMYLSVFTEVMKDAAFDWQTRVYALLAASMTKTEYVRNAVRELISNVGPNLVSTAKFLASALYRQNDIEYLKRINEILSAVYLQTKELKDRASSFVSLTSGGAAIYARWLLLALSRKIDVEWCPYLDEHGVCMQSPYVQVCILVDTGAPYIASPTLHRVPESNTYDYEECTWYTSPLSDSHPFHNVSSDIMELKLLYGWKI